MQDDWKVNKNFTLTLGLRYDYFGHVLSALNGQVPFSFFTPGQGDTLQQQVASGKMEAHTNHGFATVRRPWGLAPRLGFGWDVFGDGTTALRGGYGIYYNRIANLSFIDPQRANAPDYATPVISIQDPIPPQFTYMLGNPADGSGFLPPGGISYEVDPNGGLVGTRAAVAGQDPQLDMPRVQNWALSIQRRLGTTVTVEADYVGSRSDHLYTSTDFNRFAGDLIVNNGTLNRLNPSFSSVTYGLGAGESSAHFVSFMASKRFSSHWSARGIYTFGKALDYTSSNRNGVGGAEQIFDAFNIRAQRARSDFDVARRFTMDSVWELPGWESGIGRVLGGWTLSTTLILQSGQPFSVNTSAPFPVGDFNADGFNYDAPNTPAFGNHLSTSRSDFIRGLFTASDFPLPEGGAQGRPRPQHVRRTRPRQRQPERHEDLAAALVLSGERRDPVPRRDLQPVQSGESDATGRRPDQFAIRILNRPEPSTAGKLRVPITILR